MKSTIILITLMTGMMFSTNDLKSQEIESLSIKDILNRVIVTNDTLYIVNFWATWCKPCIEELSYFEQCNEEFKDKAVKIILVNLDFNSQVEKSVKSFIEKKKLKSKVIHVTDTDSNEWINQVEPTWSGSIPSTIMYKNAEKVFFVEGPMTYDSLSSMIYSN